MKTFKEWFGDHRKDHDISGNGEACAEAAYAAAMSESQNGIEEWFHLRRDEEIARLRESRDRANEEIVRYEKLIQNIYDACVCERMTSGFDYGESHPLLGMPSTGARWNTPKDMIESSVGFDWMYEKPSGVCRSWKELKFIRYQRNTKGFRDGEYNKAAR